MGIETTALIAYASLAASLAGAGISAYSSYQQGKAQEAMATRNAQVSQAAAENEALAATENAKRQREENRRRLASIRATQAKAGVQIGAGSTLDALSESAGELELQTLDMFRQSDAKQRALMGQSELSMWEGSQAASAGETQAIGSLLSGLGSSTGTYSSYRRTGVL